jgi:predicted transcriptional regulator
MKEMVDNGYVVMLRKRGRYIITEKANTVIKILEKEYDQFN